MQSVNPVTAITTKHFVSNVFDEKNKRILCESSRVFLWSRYGALGGVQMMTFDGSRTMNQLVREDSKLLCVPDKNSNTVSCNVKYTFTHR